MRTLKEIIKELPEEVELGYVDYRDNLDEHEDLQLDHATGGDKLEEKVWDWYIDDGVYIESHMEDLNLTDEEREKYDKELGDEMRNRNVFDPLEQLLSNTDDLAVYSETGIWLEEKTYGPDRFDFIRTIQTLDEKFNCVGLSKEENSRITDILKTYDKDEDTAFSDEDEYFITDLKDANIELFHLVVESVYGGDIVIYYNVDVKEMRDAFLSEEKYTMEINGTLVCVNTGNGSGWWKEGKNVDITLALDKGNIFIEENDQYGFFKDVVGENTSDLGTVAFVKGESKTVKSNRADSIAQEAEYRKVYAAGGCSFGDSDSTRHRNTEYINDFPCGTKCKDCGRFWID